MISEIIDYIRSPGDVGDSGGKPNTGDVFPVSPNGTPGLEAITEALLHDNLNEDERKQLTQIFDHIKILHPCRRQSVAAEISTGKK